MGKIIIIFLLIFGSIRLVAQVEPSPVLSDTTAQDSVKEKILIWSETFSNIRDNEGNNTQFLSEDVKIFHDSTFIYCDTAWVKGAQIKAMDNVVVLQNDSVKIFADTMYYNKDSLTAELINNVVIQNGENLMYSNHIYYNMKTKVATYYDTASFFLKRTKLKSVKGIYDTNIDKATFIEKVNMVDSVFHLRTDTLDFYTKEERMVFRAPTRIDQGTKKIYCEAGYYDIKNDISSFKINAQYLDINTLATADHILYNSSNEEVKLLGNAYFKDSTQLATADKIIYNKRNKSFDLFGNAHYKNEDKTMSGETIHYDELTKNMRTSGRSVIDDKTSHLEADDIDFDQLKGIGTAIGNVIYKDTKANSNIYADKMDIFDNNNKIKVYGINKRPLLESILDQDTMFLTADTLYTINKTDTSGTDYKEIRAYHDVKIFKSDLQAVADSLTYDTNEEIISLFSNPIMWSDTSQFTGDTIHLKFIDNKIHLVSLFPNAFISQSQDEIYFSQISGKRINITFNDTTITRLEVLGNAESIYYMTDDSHKYVGVSKTICTNMRFDFKNGELSRSKFAPKPNTDVLPMQTTNHKDIKLKGFTWQNDRRPLSMEDIMKSTEVSEEILEKMPQKVSEDALKKKN